MGTVARCEPFARAACIRSPFLRLLCTLLLFSFPKAAAGTTRPSFPVFVRRFEADRCVRLALLPAAGSFRCLDRSRSRPEPSVGSTPTGEALQPSGTRRLVASSCPCFSPMRAEGIAMSHSEILTRIESYQRHLPAMQLRSMCDRS